MNKGEGKMSHATHSFRYTPLKTFGVYIKTTFCCMCSEFKDKHPHSVLYFI